MAFGAGTTSTIKNECCVIVNMINADLVIKRESQQEPQSSRPGDKASRTRIYSIRGIIFAKGEKKCLDLDGPKSGRTIKPLPGTGFGRLNGTQAEQNVVINCKDGSYPGDKANRRGHTGDTITPIVHQRTDESGRKTMSMWSVSWKMCKKKCADDKTLDDVSEFCPGREVAPGEYQEGQTPPEPPPCCCVRHEDMDIDETIEFVLPRVTKQDEREELEVFGNHTSMTTCSKMFYEAMNRALKNKLPGSFNCKCKQNRKKRSFNLPEQPPSHDEQDRGSSSGNVPFGQQGIGSDAPSTNIDVPSCLRLQ
jgi:hypothetical protein